MKNRFYKYSSALKNKYQYFLLYILFFYFIFMPDLSFVNSFFKNSVVLTILLIIILIFYFKDVYKFIVQNKVILISTSIILFANFYTLVISIMNDIPIQNNINGIIFILKTLTFIGIFTLLDKYYHRNKFDFLINIFFFQSLICFCMLIFPFLKEIANCLYINNFPGYYSSPQLGIVETRIYGIASDYTFSLSISMALVSLYSLILYFKKKKMNYLIKSLFILTASMLNGRTGFFIFLLCTFIIIVYNIRVHNFEKINLIKKKFFILSSLFIMILIMLTFVDSSWINWFKSSFIEIGSLLTGKKIGVFDALNKAFFLPSGLNLIFGVGGKVYGELGLQLVGRMSDIGYVNDIFRGGLIYALFAYGAYCYIIYQAIKKSEIDNMSALNNDSLLLISSFIFILVSNYKGEAFSGSSIFFLSLYASYVYLLKKKKE